MYVFQCVCFAFFDKVKCYRVLVVGALEENVLKHRIPYVGTEYLVQPVGFCCHDVVYTVFRVNITKIRFIQGTVDHNGGVVLGVNIGGGDTVNFAERIIAPLEVIPLTDTNDRIR